jgi:hypothetical protein
MKFKKKPGALMPVLVGSSHAVSARDIRMGALSPFFCGLRLDLGTKPSLSFCSATFGLQYQRQR